MTARHLVPLVLVAGALLLAAPQAHAAPVARPSLSAVPVSFGGIHVDVGFGVPLGRRHVAPAPVRVVPAPVRVVPAPVRVVPAGRWVLEQVRVWVPGRVIGFDAYGRPISTQGYWTFENRRVWVPAPVRYEPARPRRASARGVIGIHFGF